MEHFDEPAMNLCLYGFLCIIGINNSKGITAAVLSRLDHIKLTTIGLFCSYSYECFILRVRRISSKLLKQGYLVGRFKSSFRKSYCRYGDLIQQYEVSLSRMLNDILTLVQQWPHNRSDFPPISQPWYRAWPSPNYEWFPWSICNGCGVPAGNAYPSGHLVPSTLLWTCLCSYCWNQIPRTCHVFTRPFTLNTHWYFLDLPILYD